MSIPSACRCGLFVSIGIGVIVGVLLIVMIKGRSDDVGGVGEETARGVEGSDDKARTNDTSADRAPGKSGQQPKGRNPTPAVIQLPLVGDLDRSLATDPKRLLEVSQRVYWNSRSSDILLKDLVGTIREAEAHLGADLPALWIKAVAWQDTKGFIDLFDTGTLREDEIVAGIEGIARCDASFALKVIADSRLNKNAPVERNLAALPKLLDQDAVAAANFVIAMQNRDSEGAVPFRKVIADWITNKGELEAAEQWRD